MNLTSEQDLDLESCKNCQGSFLKAREKAERERKMKEIEEARARVVDHPTQLIYSVNFNLLTIY